MSDRAASLFESAVRAGRSAPPSPQSQPTPEADDFDLEEHPCYAKFRAKSLMAPRLLLLPLSSGPLTFGYSHLEFSFPSSDGEPLVLHAEAPSYTIQVHGENFDSPDFRMALVMSRIQYLLAVEALNAQWIRQNRPGEVIITGISVQVGRVDRNVAQ